MKRSILLFSALISLSALSHTESEKLDTARYMVNVVDANTSFDTISDAPAHILEWSRPEVFFGININGWTVDEKKNAFDAYIRYIATTNCADEESRDYVAAISAIEQCCWMSRTNELESIRQFVLNTQHPYRNRITGSVLELGGLDNESIDFAEAIATNTVAFGRSERGRAFGVLWKKLSQANIGDSVASNACNRITGMFYRNKQLSVAGALSIDKLLAERLNGYAASSNRLETALFVLSQTNRTDRVTEHFTTITNQLLSSGQPLNVITVEEP
ncbi:MAG: hypothetical protein IJI36_02090 [Kiritimatiellae bacterium]|jgi:hypothetical protein|nr:hypothetical protein [Kiritimatiellia bacterium]MBQ6337911.1 hypothetical protein [Kiritimatiellia bacterium]